MTALRLSIDGMTCEHCAASVKQALDELGVHVQEVDVDAGIARIEPHSWISPDSLTHSIETSGYLLSVIKLTSQLTIPVQGMHCDNCQNRITEQLLAIDNVENVIVNRDHNQVTVTGTADLNELVTTIDSLGYQVSEPGHIELPIGDEAEPVTPLTSGKESDFYLQIRGMSCASCVSRVENRLSAVHGVTEAAVNFADETAFVKGTTDLDELLTAVRQIGYTAELVDRSVDKEQLMSAEFRKGILRSVLALCGGSLLMAGMLTGLLPSIEYRTFWLFIGVLVLVLMAVTGGHFYRNAWHSAKYLTLTMDTLIALGTGTAWTYSMLVLIVPTLVPIESRHLFFEAALFIVGFINLGKSLELNARGKASSAIEKLLDLAPDEVTLLVGERETGTPLQQVCVGDLLRIKPGDRIPVDGRITEGFSSIDESMLSGEPIPVDKQPGNSVAAGTINLHGSFVMTTEQVGLETSLARMISMVKQAQNSKPPIGVLTDSIAAVFVPLVLIVALACIVYWGWVAADGSLALVIVTAMSVLIIACPCALGLAIPISIMVGIGRGASRGLLVRNSNALQAAAGLDTIILDKTGTLTEGKPEVISMSLKPGVDESRLLGLILSLESLSEHPLARAVISFCEKREDQQSGTKALPVDEFQISPGGGIAGQIEGSVVRVGNGRFLEEADISLPPESRSEPGTVIYVAQDQELLGSLNLNDKLRPESQSAVKRLQQKGIHVVILSGDNEPSVSNIARQLNIEDYQSGLSPEGKLDRIKALQQGGKKVAMVGDGINDAPALGIADVGFAMGNGTDIAIESADIAVVGNRLDRVVDAIEISRQTMINIYQNLFGAFAYNLVLIPVAAGVLYPLLVSPTFAGLAMAMSSVTVVANANRLRFVKLD